MILEVAHLLDFLHLKSPEHMELLLLLLLLLHVVVVEGLLPSALVKTSLHYLPGLSLHAHRRGLCSCPARIALRHALRRRSAGRRRWMMLVVVVVVHGCLPSPVLPQHRPYNESAPSSNKSLHIFNEYLPLPLVSMRYFYLRPLLVHVRMQRQQNLWLYLISLQATPHQTFPSCILFYSVLKIAKDGG